MDHQTNTWVRDLASDATMVADDTQHRNLVVICHFEVTTIRRILIAIICHIGSQNINSRGFVI